MRDYREVVLEFEHFKIKHDYTIQAGFDDRWEAWNGQELGQCFVLHVWTPQGAPATCAVFKLEVPS